MKKILFALSLVFLVACSSDNDFDSNTKDEVVKYPVSFSVTNFSSEIQELRSTNLPKYSYLDYSGLKSYFLLIADEEGAYVEALERTNLKDLSSIQDLKVQLPRGNYTAYSIIMDNWDPKGDLTFPIEEFRGSFNGMGSQESRPIIGGILAVTEVLGDPFHCFSYYHYDYFYKKTNFTVTETGAKIIETLPRITGKLEFYFTDIKPLDNSVYSASSPYASITLMNATTGVIFSEGKSGFNPSDKIILTRKEWSELATKPLFFYSGETDNAQLKIDILDPKYPNDFSRIIGYTIPNIKVVENKKTIMKGALGLNNPSGFSVTIDDKWDGEINVDF